MVEEVNRRDTPCCGVVRQYQFHNVTGKEFHGRPFFLCEAHRKVQPVPENRKLLLVNPRVFGSESSCAVYQELKEVLRQRNVLMG